MYIKCRKSQFSAQLPAMLYFSPYSICIPQHIIHSFHISLPKLFPDIAAADLPFSVHLFFNHKKFISIHIGIFCKHFCITTLVMPKVEIRSDHNIPGMNFLNQDLPDEILCRHTCDIFGKRAFQQYIYFLVQKTSALLIGHDPFS